MKTVNQNCLYCIYCTFGAAGGDEETWIALGRTAQIMDNLISRQGKPMIVVMPNGNISQDAAPGEEYRFL